MQDMSIQGDGQMSAENCLSSGSEYYTKSQSSIPPNGKCMCCGKGDLWLGVDVVIVGDLIIKDEALTGFHMLSFMDFFMLIEDE